MPQVRKKSVSEKKSRGQWKPTKGTTKRAGRASAKSLRWNMQRASSEFGVHRDQLDRQRRALHIEPGDDLCFSTAQICAMAFGDKQRSEIRIREAEAQAIERRNARESGELIPVAVAAALVEPIMVIVRQKISASGMSDLEKDDMLADLESAKGLDWEKVARDAR